ncbi:hypothetical protein NDU88_008173 [Pleurodeles waltl]|uniref:Uncharacterized protein n=1 Tax=Pleurodeles waltl TaxID=8319 RepID=A0AAV7PVH0_PLEWA|nr:hypothetical protein NDU88_008173 [Pleurodeles waltl]
MLAYRDRLSVSRCLHALVHDGTIGKEAHHIFKYLPEICNDDGQPSGDVYEEEKLRLEKRFAKEENIVMSQYKFYTRPQKEGESLEDFISSLRELSVKFKIGPMTDEVIRNQLIVQCRSKKTQERLWAAKNPSLKDAITIAKIVEESEICMQEINKKGGGSAESEEVAVVMKKCNSSKHSGATSSKQGIRSPLSFKSKFC